MQQLVTITVYDGFGHVLFERASCTYAMALADLALMPEAYGDGDNGACKIEIVRVTR